MNNKTIQSSGNILVVRPSRYKIVLDS